MCRQDAPNILAVIFADYLDLKLAFSKICRQVGTLLHSVARFDVLVAGSRDPQIEYVS